MPELEHGSLYLAGNGIYITLYGDVGNSWFSHAYIKLGSGVSNSYYDSYWTIARKYHNKEKGWFNSKPSSYNGDYWLLTPTAIDGNADKVKFKYSWAGSLSLEASQGYTDVDYDTVIAQDKFKGQTLYFASNGEHIAKYDHWAGTQVFPFGEEYQIINEAFNYANGSSCPKGKLSDHGGVWYV